jgi:NADPH:quinone reductase-like Zn-dependent oxidoreductase
MKAIVQDGSGGPDALALREVEKPVPGDDQVLVRIRAASVNAADWHIVATLPRFVGRFLRAARGAVRGFDLAGEVEATGVDVTRFKPGDEVFGTGPGTFAEHVATAADRLTPKPRNLTFEQAAAIPLAGFTALQGLRDAARVRPGQRVLIHGAGGGVGTFAVQIARRLGARVTAVTRTENVDLVRRLGADEVIDYTREDFAASGRRYDVVFDIGSNRPLADGRRALVPEGRLVLVGAPKGLRAIAWRMLGARLLAGARSRRVVPFLARANQADLVVLKEMAETGTLSPVIDRRYPLGEAPDAVRYVGTGAARGKVVISVA